MRSLLNNNKTKTNISSIAGGGHLTAKPTKQLLTHKKHFIISIILVLTIVIGLPIGVNALVQNIFTEIGQITDISYAGTKIERVIYQDTTIWERPDAIQLFNAENCPTERTIVRDARDNATYWIRKIPGTKSGGGDLCWMETNLAYAGGGADAYGDISSPITLGSTSADTTNSPRYFIPAGSNRTSDTAPPSTSTDGTGQHGYLYNWCAALANQPACQNTTATQPNQSVNPGDGTVFNICPAGWRLPTGGSGGEFENLNNAINGGSTTSSAGLRTNGLYMYSSDWYNGAFENQDSGGFYFSSTANAATNSYALAFINSHVNPMDNYGKRRGLAIRCVAD